MLQQSLSLSNFKPNSLPNHPDMDTSCCGSTANVNMSVRTFVESLRHRVVRNLGPVRLVRSVRCFIRPLHRATIITWPTISPTADPSRPRRLST